MCQDTSTEMCPLFQNNHESLAPPKDEAKQKDEKMLALLIRLEDSLHTQMQRDHSEEEVMAEQPYLNNAYRPLFNRPARRPDGDWYTGVNIKSKKDLSFPRNRKNVCSHENSIKPISLAKDHWIITLCWINQVSSSIARKIILTFREADLTWIALKRGIRRKRALKLGKIYGQTNKKKRRKNLTMQEYLQLQFTLQRGRKSASLPSLRDARQSTGIKCVLWIPDTPACGGLIQASLSKRVGLSLRWWTVEGTFHRQLTWD